MNKLKLIILLIFVFSIKLGAQNMVHLCIGDNHNFGVPDNPTSTFDWSVSNPSIATIDSGNGTHHILIDLNNKGVFKLLVEEIDANGCIGYDSILVQIHDLPNPNILALGPIAICEGDSVRLEIDSLYSSVLWSNGSTFPFTHAATFGSYSAIVTDANGCSNNSNTINIDVYNKPVADFIVDGICVNTASNFISTSTVSLGNIISSIWYLGNGDVSNGDSVFYTYTYSGDYYAQLFVTSDYGCVDSIGKLHSIYDNPKADFIYNPPTISTLQPEVYFTNTSLGVVSSLWDFGDSIYSDQENPYHIYDEPGVYDAVLIVQDINECIDSISKEIMMYYDFILHVPSAFTPNDDGDNDTFGPQGLRMNKYKSYDFHIYNKWGERIFETTDVNEWWDGANFPAEVYNWVLIITDELGAVRTKNGLVTLIK